MNKNIFEQRIVRLTPMIKNYINTAAILILPTILSSGCTIIPSKNVLTMNKTIELDERAVEDINVGLRFEWTR
jgi:hypothetical protein|tara:strand:+ start:426 stop:644 length:219 start_codon:yes stop_codon:yes gene_type:complete